MKTSKKQLKQIIQEEVDKVLKEYGDSGWKVGDYLQIDDMPDEPHEPPSVKKLESKDKFEREKPGGPYAVESYLVQVVEPPPAKVERDTASPDRSTSSDAALRRLEKSMAAIDAKNPWRRG